MRLCSIKSKSAMHERLRVLESYGFITKNYDKSYKLKGLPTYYYLTPLGLRYIQKHKDQIKASTSDEMVKASYKDANVTLGFMQHTATVTESVLAMRKHHPELKVFTKRNQAAKQVYEEATPELYMWFVNDDNTVMTHQYFCDYWEASKPVQAIRAQLAKYVETIEYNTWDKRPQPAILLLLEKSQLEKRLNRRIRQMLYALDGEDLQIYTSTLDRIATEKDAWFEINDWDLDEPLSLLEIGNE